MKRKKMVCWTSRQKNDRRRKKKVKNAPLSLAPPGARTHASENVMEASGFIFTREDSCSFWAGNRETRGWRVFLGELKKQKNREGKKKRATTTVVATL